MNRYEKEYIHRINQVIDHIELNLDQELRVHALAEVANFSPFHFHRIFSAITGETINGFIKRKRVEKAATLLLNNPETPISDIAYYCGFNNVSVFCRNFKQHFNMSAQKFRESRNVEYSKKDQSNRKKSKSTTFHDEYVCSIESIKNGGTIMKKDVEIKEMPRMNLVYTRHTGAFHLIGQAYEKLMKWAGPRGFLNNPEVKVVTVYHDDPNVTEIDKVRQSACITVNEKVKTEGEFGYMTVPGGKHAVGRFEISQTEFEQAWNAVFVWLSGSGYQPRDANPYEIYHNDFKQHPENKFILDICVPVEPM